MISVNAHAGRERHSSRYLLGVEQGVMPGSVFEAMRCLIRAPHRLFFMGGLCALVVGMLWWAPVLIMRWAGVASAYPMPAVWLHAWPPGQKKRSAAGQSTYAPCTRVSQYSPGVATPTFSGQDSAGAGSGASLTKTAPLIGGTLIAVTAAAE